MARQQKKLQGSEAPELQLSFGPIAQLVERVAHNDHKPKGYEYVSNSMECPTCNEVFDSKKGMRVHHTMKHGKSLAIEESECLDCGNTFEYYPCEAYGKYCPQCSSGGKPVKFGGDKYGEWKSVAEFIDVLKYHLSCTECGFEHAAALDFHHREPEEKSFGVNKNTSKNVTLEEVKDELEKCVVLCSNCHRIKHNE